MAFFKKKNIQSIPLRTPEAIAKENAEKEAEKVRILEASLDFVRLEKHKAQQEEKAKLQAVQKETSNSVNANPLYGGVKSQQAQTKTEMNQDKVKTMQENNGLAQMHSESEPIKSEPQIKTEMNQTISVMNTVGTDSFPLKSETEQEINKLPQAKLANGQEESDIPTENATNLMADRRKLYGRRMDYKTAVVSKKSPDSEEAVEQKKESKDDNLLVKPESKPDKQTMQIYEEMQHPQMQQELKNPQVHEETQMSQTQQELKNPQVHEETKIPQEEQMISINSTTHAPQGAGQIPNPLPVPKKHISQVMNFDLEPGAEDMHFDLVDMTGIEYFDIN
ncbi:MAG: hypothetical protein ACI4DU_04560 [Lachnospiraceae bacterium]